MSTTTYSKNDLVRFRKVSEVMYSVERVDTSARLGNLMYNGTKWYFMPEYILPCKTIPEEDSAITAWLNEKNDNQSCTFEELKEHVRKLKMLLDDPHPGLLTWAMMYRDHMKAISNYWTKN